MTARVPVVTGLLSVAAAASLAAQGVVRAEGWRHLFDADPVDPGIGVLAFPAGVRPPGRRDTIPLYRRRGDAAPTGYVLREADSTGVETYAVEWPVALTTNLLEFAYEIPGLPVDSLTADGWARAIVGFRPDGAPVPAWAPATAGSAERTLWRDELTAHDLFFRTGVPPAFFDTPGGTPAAFTLPPDERDYILHPLGTRDDWIKVRVVTPSDMCADPESPRSAEVWIRYLDDRGRPLVWYHTRGC
jgi:hypothetical protein